MEIKKLLFSIPKKYFSFPRFNSVELITISFNWISSVSYSFATFPGLDSSHIPWYKKWHVIKILTQNGGSRRITYSFFRELVCYWMLPLLISILLIICMLSHVYLFFFVKKWRYDYLNSLYPSTSNDKVQISGPSRRYPIMLSCYLLNGRWICLIFFVFADERIQNFVLLSFCAQR